MTQLSLVAGYGPKSPPFADLLHRCVALIQDSPLRPYFQPYALEQIHGTIIGMERVPGDVEFINANLLARSGTRVAMDFAGIEPTLRRHLPLAIRFGGFAPDDATFLSSGRIPHERTFQVQWPTRRCTLIGWPHRGGDFTTQRALNALRDDLERYCGFGHKYRDDNDFFMVLGELVLPASGTGTVADALEEAASSLEQQVRAMLAVNPFDWLVDLADCSLVAYEDVRLCPHSTERFGLDAGDLHADTIKALYR